MQAQQQLTFIVDRLVPRQVVTKVVERVVEKPVRHRVSDLPVSEQPVNRLYHCGPTCVSTSELLAVILGTPEALSLAQELLAEFGDLSGLARASLAELRSVLGIGRTKAAQIKAALELGRRLLVVSPQERPLVRSPADAANLLMMEMSLLDQEHLRVILLDTKNHVLAVETVYQGNVNTAVIRVGELFRDAIRQNCAAIIVVHNHPSGDPTPSPEDVHITEKIVEAGQLMDIEVLDHLIVGNQRYVSLKERGLGFG